MVVSSSVPRVVDVWARNLEEEFAKMLQVVESGEYPYVTMDTEFPGIVMTEGGSRYTELRRNVDALRLIQLGIAFSNEKGESPLDTPCWQFNFEFDVTTDLYAADSITLLHQAGLDFRKHQEEGISPEMFGEYLNASGLVLNEDIRWICFHGCYDFAYLIKVLTGNELPATRDGMVELMDIYFPQRVDLKYLAKTFGHHGSLVAIAEQRGINVHNMHQGGFDAIITRDVFFDFPEAVRSGPGSVFVKGHDLCNSIFGLDADSDSEGTPKTPELHYGVHHQTAAHPGTPNPNFVHSVHNVQAQHTHNVSNLFGVDWRNDYQQSSHSYVHDHESYPQHAVLDCHPASGWGHAASNGGLAGGDYGSYNDSFVPSYHRQAVY